MQIYTNFQVLWFICLILQCITFSLQESYLGLVLYNANSELGITSIFFSFWYKIYVIYIECMLCLRTVLKVQILINMCILEFELDLTQLLQNQFVR
jgi:hypothetical protein